MNGTPEEFRGIGPPLGPEADGQRTDLFLSRAFPFNSRNEWNALCRRGELLVNGRPVRASHRLRSGDKLSYLHPQSAEPEVDTAIAFLKEEDGILAVYKPANLPMHENGLFRRNTLQALVHAQIGAEWFPVHRLDRETSGVVLCAATSSLRRALSEALESRTVEKRYLAIMDGATAWDERLVDEPIAPVPTDRIPLFKVDPSGTEACTLFRTLERAEGATLVEALPKTGKTNQIRVHAAYLGHPLVGDKLYHHDTRVYDAYHAYGDTAEVRALAGFPRHALHAASIALAHPETGRIFSAESPLPEDLQTHWAARTLAGLSRT